MNNEQWKSEVSKRSFLTSLFLFVLVRVVRGKNSLLFPSRSLRLSVLA